MEILRKKTYLEMIARSKGTEMFRSLFARNGNGEEDLLGGGKRSCAVYVSSIAFLFGLVSSQRATVTSLERDLSESGWRETDKPGPGDIIFWEPKLQNGGLNAHVGFCLDSELAISNDWETGAPAPHHITYGTKENGEPVRAITAIYTHDFLSELDTPAP